MIYSRDYLNATAKSPDEVALIHGDLIAAVRDGVELTLAEAKYIGTVLEAMFAIDNEVVNLLERIYDQLDDYKFWQIFMRYAKDVDGWAVIPSPYGPVPLEQKRIDANYLEREYQLWKPLIHKTNHKQTVMQFLSKQARDELKEALEWSKQQGEGYFRRLYIEKFVTLYSKFVFIKVAEYYQEYDVKKDSMTFCGKETIVDSFAYTHILMRHFSPTGKFGRPGLTFHHDQAIDVNNLPKSILYFLGQYDQHIGINHFNRQQIYFNLNDRNYVIWFKELPRNIAGGGQLLFLRVQTFYPAELANDVLSISKMIKVRINGNLSFYIVP
jgi:hypothetical protein